MTSCFIESFDVILKYFYQEDAREAAKDEEERIQIIMEVSDSDFHKWTGKCFLFQSWCSI